MTLEQHDRVMEVVRALDLTRGSYNEVERMDGYQLEHADGRRPYIFGYVRFNQDGGCTVYAYREFWDPEGRFQRQASGNNFRYTFNPDDESAMSYAIRSLRSSFDRSR